MTRRRRSLLTVAASWVAAAAVVAAATESRFRRRRPQRALGASARRTGAAFSDLQCRGLYIKWQRSAIDGASVGGGVKRREKKDK